MSEKKSMQAVRLYNTKNMSDEEWRAHRLKGIGGSDVSAIVGINRWKSKLQVYMEKTGAWEPEDISHKDAVHFGHKLEDVVAREFADRTGYKIQNCNFILQHPEHPFMFANIDREIVQSDKGRGVLEIKTTSAWNADQWTSDEVPHQYMVQVQHYLAVTGYDFAYIAVLIGGNSYDHWLIERDDELINILIEQERDFWQNHVEQRIAPEPNYADDGDIIDQLYFNSNGDEMELDDTRTTELLEQIEETQAEVKRLKALEDTAKTELKDIIRENEVAIHNKARITWKAPKPTEYVKPADLKEKYPDIWSELKQEKQSSRRFTIKFKKGEN